MKKLLVALLMVPSMAHAEFVSGNDLLSRLKSSEYMDKMYGLGYVLGVFDAGQHIRHCAPNGNGINAGQIQDMVQQYLEQNPSLRNMAADLLVTDAIRRVWPCKSKNKGA